MKKTKGIGPNNLGVSKAAVKNAYGKTMVNKSAYGDSMAESNKFAKAVAFSVCEFSPEIPFAVSSNN